MKFTTELAKRGIVSFLFGLLSFGSAAYAQSASLSLGSGSAAQGGSVPLNLTLAGSGSAGLQWTLSYASKDVASVSAVAGPALTSASKTLNCASGATSITCLATGMNTNIIGSGVIASVTVNLTSSAGASVSVPMSNVMGVGANGMPTAASGTGGTITVAQPLTISTLQCSPSTVTGGASANCTATLSAAAPTGGTTVTLSDNNASVTVPSSVTVAAGATSAAFTATTTSVTSTQTASITASCNSKSASTSLTVMAPGAGAQGVVAAYAFGEGTGSTTADASGNGITGAIQGATWTASGKYGQALSFNGSSSYVDLGNPTSLQGTGSMSWSAWVNAAGNPPDDGQIVAQSDSVSGWQFKTTPDTGVRTFGVAVASNGAHTQRYSKTVLALNTWYHVAAVYNALAQTLDIYVNGVLDNGSLTGTIPSSQVPAALNATIGKRSGGYYFNGTIDNLRIYNRALSASEIQTDMNTPADSSASGVTLQSLQCSPTAVVSGGTSTCTVTLSAAAQTGTAVTISDNSAALTVPASVTVAAGSTTANFTATAGSVTATQPVTITGSLNGSSATASLTVAPPASAVTVSKLQCAPATVASNGTSTCTVTLSAAPTAATAVAIADNSTALTVPASVTVAAGSSTANFTATAGTVTSNQSVTITASLNGSSATASVGITPPAATISQLQCAPATVASNGTAACTVTLSAAPTAATSVAIADNSSALTVPSSVTVNAGTNAATFTANAGTVTSNQTVTITASLNGSSATASVGITPPASTVSQLQCAPSTVASNGTAACTVTLSAAATAATSVAISDNSSALTVPASVTVAAGSSTANFTATAGSVTATQPVTVTASLNGTSATASLTVQQAAVLVSAAYPFSEGSGSTTADASGNAITGAIQGATWTSSGKYGSALWFNGSNSYVDLGTPASLQGTGSMTWSAWVNAAANPSNDGQIVAQSDSVSGWQFKTTPDTGVRTFGVAVASNGTHTQRYSKTVLVLNTWYHVAGVYDAAAQKLDIYVNGVLDNGTLNGTVPSSQVPAALNATVGKRAGGYYFNGTIDNLRIYNRALSASEIQTDMNTPVSGGSPLPGVTLQSLQCSPAAVVSGTSSTCTVTLSAAAQASSAVSISDSSTALTVPASVTVAAGSTTASFTATAGSVTSDQSVTITASLNGSSATAPLTVRPAVATLSAAYSFNEGSGATTADVSGNGATGRISQASWTNNGKHGAALSFNGNNSYVDLGSPASLQSTGSMTWSAWVNVSGNPSNDGQIIARSDNGSGWQLKITPDTGKRTFGVAVSGSAGTLTQRYSKTVYSTNTWYYVAGVYDASAHTLDIYVNGVLDNGTLVGTVPAWQYVPALNTTIGKRSGGYYFKGVIDDVRVYSRALTQAEIQSDMNVGVTAP